MVRSLFSGMSGLKSHQTKMDVIGNNISNVNTFGFKSSRVSFRDAYYQTISNAMGAQGTAGGSNASQIGYGSMVSSIDMNAGRSSYTPTGFAMDCYINGEGYFVVRDGNENLYTRIGMLGFDGSGNLVDGTKKMVLGYNVDHLYNAVTLDRSTVHFGADNGELLEGYNVQVVYAAPGAAEDIAVNADNASKTITITYTPDAAAAPADQTLTNTKLQTALQGAWNGTPPAGLDMTQITVTQAVDQPDSVVGATNGLVSTIASFDLTAEPAKITNTFGQLINTSIDGGGIITGQTPDGKVVVIGRIALANIPNPGALEMVGESMYRASGNTGDITYTAPGGDNLGWLKTHGLEMSGVDLTNEFSEMITTQRGFQACSKIITVSDEMLEILVNLKR